MLFVWPESDAAFQSVPEWCREQAKLLCGAGSRSSSRRSSQRCLHPRGPPCRLAAALAPAPCAVGKEHLAMESDGKLVFLLPNLFVLPELIAGEEGLSGVPSMSAEILASISSNMQTICRQLQHWEQGRRDALEPSSALVSWRGPLEHPCALTKSSTCAHPGAPTDTWSRRWTGCWGGTCPELGDLQDGPAKPRSPPVGSHSGPVCPVCSSPRGATGTTRTIPPQLR